MFVINGILPFRLGQVAGPQKRSEMYHKALQWSHEKVPRAIRELAWDESNVEHLWHSHQVTPEEVEEALLGDDGTEADYLMTRDTDYYAFLATSADGRPLSLVGEFLDDGRLYIFSARNMNEAQKRRYRRR